MENVLDPKILVAGIGQDARFAEWMHADSTVYRQFFSHVEETQFSDARKFLQDVGRLEYDVLHSFMVLTEEGRIASSPDVEPMVFVKACEQSNAKVVFIGNNNSSDGYITAFQPSNVNLVMTVDRKGGAYPEFLAKLIQRMQVGRTMAEAWVEVFPQTSDNPDLAPDCIFSVGRPGVRVFSEL